ncbi:unnamed protein product [Blepharisma stoltei]|uniref:Uncharacterized protein n=1 Tax=Blepharisma stoltei TaxID=1481888 RepID=A0AAU9ISF9_9CILI|nr:unnamed protein product [Blepharisma stoltei]
MDILEEVREWESTLREELEGLQSCKEKVEEDTSIPVQIRERFVEVLRTLKMNMVQVMAKCSQLRSESLTPKAVKARAERLRTEYNETIKNLKKLLATADPSRQTQNQKSNVKARQYAQTEVMPDKLPENVYSVLQRELVDLRQIIKRVKKDLKSHKHSEYEQRVEALEMENKRLKTQLGLMQEEHTEALQTLHLLKSRLDRLESQQYIPLTPSEQERTKTPIRDTSAKRERFLLKPSNDAERMLSAT